MIKTVVFDIGQTLIEYNRPLNWESLYISAFQQIGKECGFDLSSEDFEQAVVILRKYNTRVNPREIEVSSYKIFQEILDAWKVDFLNLEDAKERFYSFFRSDVTPFDDSASVLRQLQAQGITTATFSDVPYGMDNKYVFQDILKLREFIDWPITSNDVGYRKPNTKGLEYIVNICSIETKEMMYVGDEEKDMICANDIGAYSVLINRSDVYKKYGQKATIRVLSELLKLL